ncbi:MAG: hypothetical protein ACT4P6_13415 [Gemmatimonadaceae bacterium]
MQQQMPRRRWPRALTFLVLAPVLATALDAQAYRARVRLPAYPAVIALDTIAIRSDVSGARGEVFQVAAAALEHEFKIELRLRDSTAGVVGNLEIVKLRRLGNAAMSRYVSCGSGMTGPNADSYRIFLAIAAFVDSLSAGKTRLGVALAASAQDLQGSAKQPIACGSTGAVESQIRRAVALRFGDSVR